MRIGSAGVLLLPVVLLVGCDGAKRGAAPDRDGGGDATTSAVFHAGIVEGFYGAPYSPAERAALVRFLGEKGLDTYLYAPKLDAKHRAEWRTPYTADEEVSFRELVGTGAEAGVRIVFGLSPGLDYDPTAGDLDALETKLGRMNDLGIADFCVLFDDLGKDSPGAAPDVQVEAVTRTFEFLRARDARASLCLVPNYYIGTAEELRSDATPLSASFALGSSAFYEAYRRLPTDVPLLWTGKRVFADRVTAAETAALREYIGRPLVLWDNFPDNDLFANELFMGPYVGREAAARDSLQGVLLNPMLEPHGTRVALSTLAEWMKLGPAYDADAAWSRALGEVGRGAEEAFRSFAEQFVSHPLIGDAAESPVLARAVASYFGAPGAATLGALRGELTREQSALSALDLGLQDRALMEEIRAPAQKLALLAEAGLIGLDLVEKKGNGAAVDVAPFDAKIAEANALPWLVAKNSDVSGALLVQLSERAAANRADVFGDLFSRIHAAL